MVLPSSVFAVPESAALSPSSPVVVGGAVVVTAVLASSLAYLYVLDLSESNRDESRTTVSMLVVPLLFVFAIIVFSKLLTGS